MHETGIEFAVGRVWRPVPQSREIVGVTTDRHRRHSLAIKPWVARGRFLILNVGYRGDKICCPQCARLKNRRQAMTEPCFGQRPLDRTPCRNPWILEVEDNRNLKSPADFGRKQHWIVRRTRNHDRVHGFHRKEANKCTFQRMPRAQAEVPDTERSSKLRRERSDLRGLDGFRDERCQTGIETLLVVRFMHAENNWLPARGRQVLGKMPCTMNARNGTRREVRRDQHNGSLTRLTYRSVLIGAFPLYRTRQHYLIPSRRIVCGDSRSVSNSSSKHGAKISGRL